MSEYMGAEGFYGLILITLFSSLPLFSSPLLFPSSLPLFSSPLPCMEYSKDDQDDHPTDRQIILSLTVFVILLLLLLYYYYKQVKKSLLENIFKMLTICIQTFSAGLKLLQYLIKVVLNCFQHAFKTCFQNRFELLPICFQNVFQLFRLSFFGGKDAPRW